MRNLVLLSDKVSKLAFRGSLRAVKEPALVSDPPSAVSPKVDAQLPSIRALVEPWSNASGHRTSARSSVPTFVGTDVGTNLPRRGDTLEIEPTTRAFSVGLLRLELRTSALSVLRSNQLSYSPDETVTLHQLHLTSQGSRSRTT